MAGWMINCKEYATLLSKSMDHPLPFWKKVSVRMHQVLCPPCKHIQEQFKLMRKACRFAPTDATFEASDGSRLSDEVCQRIKTTLRKAADEKDV